MSEIFVVSNQLGQYWGKKKCWVDGSDAKKVMTLKHRDEGLNLLVELSSRDIELRGEVLAATASDRGVPRVVASEHLIVEVEETPSDPEAGPSDPEEAPSDPEES